MRRWVPDWRSTDAEGFSRQRKCPPSSVQTVTVPVVHWDKNKDFPQFGISDCNVQRLFILWWWKALLYLSCTLCLLNTKSWCLVIYAPPLVISSSCRLNSCGLRTFSVLGPRLCNSLPRLPRDTSHNTTSFGHSLKTFFSLRVLVHTVH